jgi:uncharacterized membrane protein
MKRAMTRPTIAAVSGLAALGAVTAGLGDVVRTPLVLWFLLVCPGMTVVELLGLTDPLLRFIATIGISIAVGVFVAQTLLFLGLWSPVLGLGILCTLTVVAAVFSAKSATGSLVPRAGDGV